MQDIESWKKKLNEYTPNSKYSHDTFALEACKLALQAVEQGNFGVGCVVVDPNGAIVSKGYNQVFNPTFRSDLHGEMVAMNALEKSSMNHKSLKGFSVFTSLESCPMCLSRLIISGCEHIYHLAEDPLGGMVHLKHQMPPIWQDLMQNQEFKVADCSKDLVEAATEIVQLNAEELNEKLKRMRE